jgi:hypothetical protein
VEDLLLRTGCDRLTVSQSPFDTYITRKGDRKGFGLREVKSYLGCSEEPVVAMGDSHWDCEMLAAADVAYAPANASETIRDMVFRGRCRQTGGALQVGLLEAATEVCRKAGHSVRSSASDRQGAPAGLIDRLLSVPDRGRLRLVLDAVRWRSL